MTLLAEDLLLLLLDDTSGKAIVDSTRLERVLAGGLLLELALFGRVTPAVAGEPVKAGRLVVRDPSSTGDDLLDRTLARLAEGKPRKPEQAVERLAKKLRPELLTRLATQGLLHEQRGRALGIFPTTSWPALDTTRESELRSELRDVLIGGAQPALRTAALVSLLAAVDAAPKVVDASDRRAVKRRAKAIADGEWAGAAVRKAVMAVNGAVAAAVVATTAATTAGS